MTPWRIEPMTERDWPDVRRIYLEGIATGDGTFETSAPEWVDWDANHLPHARFVARSQDGTAGWAALSPMSRRAVYRGVAEVTVYAAEAYRGQGVGKALMEALVRESEARGIWTLQASIFPENRASIRLHEGVGFREVGRRERIGCQNGRWRDTILLERRSNLAGI